LKHLLGCHHLYFHSQNGIELQVYCAIIVCMLISLWTGRKPTKRTFEMVGYYFLGLANESESVGASGRTKTARLGQESGLTSTVKLPLLRPLSRMILAA
jgi:hypothetical protein